VGSGSNPSRCRSALSSSSAREPARLSLGLGRRRDVDHRFPTRPLHAVPLHASGRPTPSSTSRPCAPKTECPHRRASNRSRPADANTGRSPRSTAFIDPAHRRLEVLRDVAHIPASAHPRSISNRVHRLTPSSWAEAEAVQHPSPLFKPRTMSIRTRRAHLRVQPRLPLVQEPQVTFTF